MESIIININYCYNYNTFNEVDSFYSLDILKFTVSICPAAGQVFQITLCPAVENIFRFQLISSYLKTSRI